jgi:DNA-binding FrmR family transcriptional regulator
MDKKSKKRIDVLRSSLQRLRQQLSGVQQQQDDLAESQALRKQIAAVEAELQGLTGPPNSKR